MKKRPYSLMLLLVGFSVFVACKKNKADDPTPDKPLDPQAGDEEIITRVELHLEDSADVSQKKVVRYNDPQDGLPTTDKLVLLPAHTYYVTVKIFNDIAQPVDTISNEIEEEANAHRFHYRFTRTAGDLSLATTLTDQDSHVPPQPLGLAFTLKSAGSGEGDLEMNLRHFGQNTTKNSDPTAGEQDILVTFPVEVR